MRRTAMAIALLALLVAPALAAPAVPTKPGACVATTIARLATRYFGAADSGDTVHYANGLAGVSRVPVPELRRAKAGDKVTLCLRFVPRRCQPDDDRGTIYAATDKRTAESWTLPNADRRCNTG